MHEIIFYLLVAPFLLQGLVMIVDEFYYHHKRRLPLWEVIGHPLDSITVLACFIYLNIVPYSDENLRNFIFISIFSCIFVTKDEFVHSKLCTTGEMWLHSLLFILHPLTFASGAYIWRINIHPGTVRYSDIASLNQVLQYQLILVIFFAIYQIMYWSLPWRSMWKSITASTTP